MGMASCAHWVPYLLPSENPLPLLEVLTQYKATLPWTYTTQRQSHSHVRPRAVWSHYYGTAQRHTCLLHPPAVLPSSRLVQATSHGCARAVLVPYLPLRPQHHQVGLPIPFQPFISLSLSLQFIHPQRNHYNVLIPFITRALCSMIHRPALDNARSASVFISSAVATRSRPNSVLSDLTRNNNSNGCFLPRKRARVGDLAGATLHLDMQGQRALLPLVSAPVPVPLPAGDVQNRLLCSASASTSEHPTASVAPVLQGLLSHLYRHGVEIDALVRIEVG
jgi:hypothetical protein